MNKLILFLLGSIFLLLSCSETGIDETGDGILRGTVVTFGDNTPLGNVKITTIPASNTVFTADNGKFVINGIAIGDYSVQAELRDYTTAFEAAVISDGQTINVVFEMELAEQNNQNPRVPNLIFPEDNDTEVPLDITFVWSSSDSDDDEILYTLELRNGSNNEIFREENISDTIYAYNNLQLGVNYFWQITADDDVNDPVESSIGSFSTKDPSLNRFFYVRKEGNNNIIYSGADLDDDVIEVNENEIQLTPSNTNSFRPRMNQTADKIAFLRTVGANTQLFAMNLDGTDVDQLTNGVPVVGFRQDEIDYTWYQNGERLYYTNLNKLYSVNSSGNGDVQVYETAPGVLITEVDVNEVNGLIAIKTNDANGYNARIVILNPDSGIEQNVVVENLSGALGGIDYSIDGTKVLYTRDVSGFISPNYRQLDSRIFVYDLITNVTVEIDTQKPVGTNDLDCKYSPDEGLVIFMNTSNDGVSEKRIFKIALDDILSRELLFTNASMPDWE